MSRIKCFAPISFYKFYHSTVNAAGFLTGGEQAEKRTRHCQQTGPNYFGNVLILFSSVWIMTRQKSKRRHSLRFKNMLTKDNSVSQIYIVYDNGSLIKCNLFIITDVKECLLTVRTS